MEHWLAFAIGVSSGLLASLVAGSMAFRREIWHQRRHDYGQLLRELEKGKPQEILERLELVALIAPKHISHKATEFAGLVGTSSGNDVNSALRKRIREEMFPLMYRDVQPELTVHWFGGLVDKVKARITT
jgi:hypothetical protein